MAYYLYIANHVNNGDVPIGPSKVGVTKDLTARLRTLQTGNPHQLEILFKYALPDEDEARRHERNFHRRHGSLRMKGEWFDICPIEAARHIPLDSVYPE